MIISFQGQRTAGCGSYSSEDVHFLLRPMQLAPIEVEAKEALIQSGQRHYSEMISYEAPPSKEHKALYVKALAHNSVRMAADVQSLALALNEHYSDSTIILVSFVRAGLPLGVLLCRTLTELGRVVHHYGISIVRDRGVDSVALDAIVKEHGADSIVFVDGWTGKGAIAGEIKRSLIGDIRFPEGPRLVVLADPCGMAWLAASHEDWIIPSGILGATVSGLISRSIWPQDNGLHGCVVYDHLKAHDVTREFIDTIERDRARLPPQVAARPWSSEQRDQLQANALAVIDGLASRFGITNYNQIKPGIAEATRAVLRRVPERVLVRNCDDEDVQLLKHLTDLAGIEIEEVGAALTPYRAVTIIRSVS
ncbi:MAG TPA: cysteine protease StiP domain-containing protein [Arenimonas sp.]|nr:cysteine protease StiP domain-containing protein [Arenimonas sp.]